MRWSEGPSVVTAFLSDMGAQTKAEEGIRCVCVGRPLPELTGARKMSLGRRSKVWIKKLFWVLIGCMISLFVLSLVDKYWSLFYWETFLPMGQLPRQERSPSRALRGDETLVDSPQRPRILCLVVTSPENHATRAVHVEATWGRRCHKLVFATSTVDGQLEDVIAVPEAEGYYKLWQKVRKGLEWAHTHGGNYEWLLKADDDSFIFMENLVEFLTPFEASSPVVSGIKLRTWSMDEIYLNGGASYVISRSALTLLVEKGFHGKRCDDLKVYNGEDVNMATCLHRLGVTFLDSRDESNRQRFHIYPPQELIDPRQSTRWSHLWLKKLSVYPYEFGYSELSDKVISFHYVDAETMYLMEYLVYYVNPSISRVSFHRNGEKDIQKT